MGSVPNTSAYGASKATAKRFNYPKVTTPLGKAIWPWLTKADTKFEADGQYKVTLSIPAEEAQGLVDKIDEITEHEFNAVKDANPKKKIITHLPYEEELDEDDNETGNILFKCKTNAVMRSKKTGETWDKTLPIFDAQGQKITNKIAIYGGSMLKLNLELRHYFVASTKMVGVSLAINAVQVIKLVEGGFADEDASEFGFGEEEGYTRSEETFEDTDEEVTETIDNAEDKNESDLY